MVVDIIAASWGDFLKGADVKSDQLARDTLNEQISERSRLDG
jgi:hypothetical protein